MNEFLPITPNKTENDMKSILSICMVLMLMFVAVPSTAAFVDIEDHEQIEQVIEVPSADQSITVTEFESYDSPVIDVGKDVHQMITSDFENDHQVFSTELRQYEQLNDHAETAQNTNRGYRSMNHSPPQLGFN